jgi:hypothetical protein
MNVSDVVCLTADLCRLSCGFAAETSPERGALLLAAASASLCAPRPMQSANAKQLTLALMESSLDTYSVIETNHIDAD